MISSTFDQYFCLKVFIRKQLDFIELEFFEEKSLLHYRRVLVIEIIMRREVVKHVDSKRLFTNESEYCFKTETSNSALFIFYLHILLQLFIFWCLTNLYHVCLHRLLNVIFFDVNYCWNVLCIVSLYTLHRTVTCSYIVSRQRTYMYNTIV